MTRYLLAHDLGTSGNKATLFSTEGSLIQSVVYPYDTHYFNGTWVEQDAQDWWKAVCESTRELLKKTEIQADAIEAVSFSGQMMGCLCVDKNGIPLRPAIIWADQRATEQSAQIDEKINQYDYYRIVGHRNIASYGIQKFMWIRDHEREIYERTYKILNAKDYIVYCLTGKFCTDYSDANSCGFFDLKRLCWSEQLLEYAKIPIGEITGNISFLAYSRGRHGYSGKRDRTCCRYSSRYWFWRWSGCKCRSWFYGARNSILLCWNFRVDCVYVGGTNI